MFATRCVGAYQRGWYRGCQNVLYGDQLLFTMSEKVVIIVGAGSKWDKDGNETDFPPSVRFGLGGALALRFAAKGYHVVLCGRRMDVLEKVHACVAAAGGKSTPVACDVTSDESVKAAMEKGCAIGAVESVIYNVGQPIPEGFSYMALPKAAEISPEYFNAGFDRGVTGCVRVAAHTIPALVEAAKAEGGSASFLVSGATMALRGKANFACMAPHKAALRMYSQSLFDTYAREGVHVSHVVIDGAFDSPGTNPFGKHVTLMDPDELAGVYVGLHEQPKSVWSFEIQVGPSSGDMGMRL